MKPCKKTVMMIWTALAMVIYAGAAANVAVNTDMAAAGVIHGGTR